MKDIVIIPLLFPLVMMGVIAAWVAIIESIIIKVQIRKAQSYSKSFKKRMRLAWGLQLNSIVFTYFNLGIWYSFVRDTSMWSPAGTIDMICLGMSAMLVVVEANFDKNRLYYSVGHVMVWGYFTLIFCYKAYLAFQYGFE